MDYYILYVGSNAVLFASMLGYRLIMTHRYFVKTGLWSDRYCEHADVPLDIRTNSIPTAILNVMLIMALFQVLWLFFAAIYKYYTLHLLLCVMASIVFIGAYILVSLRERAKQKFYDRLGGEH